MKRVAVFVFFSAPLLAATFDWTGPGTDAFTESNWSLVADTGDGSEVLTINPSTDVNHDLLISSGDAIASGGHLQLATNTLTVTGGSLTVNSSNGIRMDATAGGGRTSASFGGTGKVTCQFLADINAALSGDFELKLNGAGNPLNNASVAITTPFTGFIHFAGESVASATSEHLSKITIDGQVAQIGVNCRLYAGATGGAVLDTVFDSDGDQLPDTWEYTHFGNLSRDGTGDFEPDGLTDLQEFQRGTDPKDSDSDDDNLADGAEVTAGTDPANPDTDHDGLKDGVETDTGIYVSESDTGTDPLDPNTDSDRVRDGGEVAQGTDPNNATSFRSLPNVIFILADDLGIGEVGAYGQQKILTPNIDALATSGMRFDAYYSPSAVCAPTRAMLLTGQHAGRCPIRNNGEVGNGYQTPLPAGSFTLGHLMRNAGYTTACIGKWGLGAPGTVGDPLDQGFDHFFGYLGQVQAHHYYPSFLENDRGRSYYSPTLAAQEGGTLAVPGANNETGFNNLAFSLANKNNNGNVHSHDAMTREAMSWIDTHSDEAFFLYLAYPIPHTSIQAPGHIDDLTDADGIVFNNTARTCVDEFYPTRPFGAPISHPGSGSYTGTADKRHEYAAMISAMDRDIGRLVAQLQSLGIADNTLIIFTSDNGVTFLGEVDYTYFNSAMGLRGLKNSIYEGGIRAPFIAKWPGKIAPGTSSPILGNLDDVMPTLGELTGSTHPPDVTGRSILPTLLGENDRQIARDELYFEFGNSGSWTRAVRKGDWKLQRFVNKTTGVITRELYNLATDPAESNNLASANAAKVAELERVMDSSRELSELFPRPNDEFPVYSGVTVSYGALGVRLDGTGHAVVPLQDDVTGPCEFQVGIHNDGGFLFGSGNVPSEMIQVTASGGQVTISYLGQSASLAMTGNDFAITWDPGASKVTVAGQSGSPLSLTLNSPPTLIRYIGYRVDGTATDFSPAVLQLSVPDLGAWRWQKLSNGLRIRYDRPVLTDAVYVHESSDNLENWKPVRPYREQAIDAFGGQRTVELDFAPPPAGVPRVFYRVRETH